MNDEPYKNRELDVRFQNLAEKIDENHNDTTDKIGLLDRKIGDKHGEILGFLEEIKAQTTKTNGRVTKLEVLRMAAYLASGLIVVVAGLIVYIYQEDKKALEDKIEAAKEIGQLNVQLKKTTR